MKRKVRKKLVNEIRAAVSILDHVEYDDSGMETAWFSSRPIKGKRLTKLIRTPGVFTDDYDKDGLMTTAVRDVVRRELSSGADAGRLYAGVPKFNPERRYEIIVEPPHHGGNVWHYRFAPVNR